MSEFNIPVLEITESPRIIKITYIALTIISIGVLSTVNLLLPFTLALIASLIYLFLISFGVLAMEMLRFKLSIFLDKLVIERFGKTIEINFSDIKKISILPKHVRFTLPQASTRGLSIYSRISTLWHVVIYDFRGFEITRFVLISDEKDKFIQALNKVKQLKGHEFIIESLF